MIKNFSKRSEWLLIATLFVLVVGILFLVISPESSYLTGIGCSLIASCVVTLANIFLFEATKDPLRKWKISDVYEERGMACSDADSKINKLKDGERIDGIAFGLRAWRNKNTDSVLFALNQGVQIRLITMDPKSQFVTPKAEEDGQNENLEQSINDLIAWAECMNNKSKRGKIKIKGYPYLTMNYYWRVGSAAYWGPFLKGRGSQSTITLKTEEGGEAFRYYSNYFENLWDDNGMVNLV